jgi:membrane dipeptidase
LCRLRKLQNPERKKVRLASLLGDAYTEPNNRNARRRGRNVQRPTSAAHAAAAQKRKLTLLQPTRQTESLRRARELHFRSIVLDTHVDTTQRLLDGNFDLGARHDDGSVDIPRLRQGGVSAVFFAIWVPGTITGSAAVEGARKQIAAIRLQIGAHATEVELARTADDVRCAHAQGKIAILMALEGGHMINRDLGVLREYASLGVRYMTLTHFRNTEWADASTDEPVHNGLSDFGRPAIAEMNRLGMIVDVSHVSDKTVRDVLAVSQAPIFASHSSCRSLCDTPRNLPDDLIRAVANRGGVVQINFHAGFVSQEFRDAETPGSELSQQIEAEGKKRCGENAPHRLVEWDKIVREFVAADRLPRVEWTQIVDHVDHAVKIAGAEHVGLGSDFDGASMPYGMEDASMLPRITEALVERGYSDSDVQKILGGNTLRLMQDVEAAAQTTKGTK